MATVNLGAIKFNWKGAYNSGTAYVADDVVSSGGSSYICILASTGNAVNDATYWSQMSQAGTNGTNGTDLGTVITTQGDIAYRDTSGLQRLAAGTAGQVLKTQGASADPVWADGGGGLVSVQVFEQDQPYRSDTSGNYHTSSDGSHTWTKPAGIKLIRVQLCGGGASGSTSGKAGGAGGYTEGTLDVTSIASVAITVGAQVQGHNTAGRATSFGSYFSATGGRITNQWTGNTSGGNGGIGTGGAIILMGGGGSSQHSDGGSAGAASYFGGGSFGQQTSNLGYHPASWGSGGSGCNNGYGSGSGAGGVVIVWEYK